MHAETTRPAVPEHRQKLVVPGHPGIFKKGQRYLVTYRHKGRQTSRSFRTLSEASRYKAQVAAGDAQPTSREPFRRYAERWIAVYSGRTSGGVASLTRDSYADAIVRVAVPYFGTTRIDEIDAPMMRDFIRSLAARGFAQATVRRYYAPVRALLATAYEDGLIRTNPAANVRVIAPRTTARKRRLTPAETRALLAQMPPEHADLAYVLAATGLRIGEALSARWSDFGQSVDGRPALTVPKSKTPSGQRVIPLSPETLRRLVLRRSGAAFPAGGDPIFPNRFGRPIDAHNYRQRVFNPAARLAGVEWATPHTLRHGIASLMADHGSTPSQIASLLGHADGGVLALKTYIHAEMIDAPSFIDDALILVRGGSTAGSTTHPNLSEPQAT
jgi:integrase